MHMVNGRLEDAAAVPALKWHDTPMWRGLEGMRIEPPDAALSFVERLGADNGWDECFAESVYRQYLRFLYLSATSETPLTPSDAVDQAWHLHLAYSRHYWDVLCGEILRRAFHHGPTAGGRDESAKHRAQYDDTVGRYRAVFGEEPPADIWPPVAKRFAARGVRVDRTEAWVVPKRVARAAAALAGATAVTAACSADGLGGVERLFVLLILVVLGLAVLHQFLPGSRRRRKNGGCSGYSGDSDGAGDGDGGGGCGGCGGD